MIQSYVTITRDDLQNKKNLKFYSAERVAIVYAYIGFILSIFLPFVYKYVVIKRNRIGIMKKIRSYFSKYTSCFKSVSN